MRYGRNNTFRKVCQCHLPAAVKAAEAGITAAAGPLHIPFGDLLLLGRHVDDDVGNDSFAEFLIL